VVQEGETRVWSKQLEEVLVHAERQKPLLLQRPTGKCAYLFGKCGCIIMLLIIYKRCFNQTE